MPHRKLCTVLVGDAVRDSFQVGLGRHHEALPGAVSICPAAAVWKFAQGALQQGFVLVYQICMHAGRNDTTGFIH